MIWDWQLWPWIVADGAGEVAVSERRIAVGVRRDMQAIGLALMPAMHDLAAALRKAVA